MIATIDRKTGEIKLSEYVIPVEEQLAISDSELKAIGLPYELDSVIYQVPLDLDAQMIVNAWTTAYIAGYVTNTLTVSTVDTVMKFSNGVEMPITTPDWMQFAEWFKNERNKFFKKDATNV